MVSSKNASSRVNQQERLKTVGWVVGFTDGEGCFSVSIFKNHTTKNGWQIFPEFVVTQGEKSLSSLQLIKEFFGCGRIFVNRRHDNHNENLYRFCVRDLKDLREKIVPFFDSNLLKTAKIKDFRKFREVIFLMTNKEHLTSKGFQKISNLVRKQPF